MSLKKPITLIGLMGAGKTTIGLHLAQRLKVDFVDSDKEIESQAGATVAEIFARDGEQFFRKVEAKTISEILQRAKPCILATGGGAMMNEETRQVVKEKSISVWLRAGLDTLVERVEHNNARPLLNNTNKREILEKLMRERYPVYEMADIAIDTDSNSRTVVTNRILKELELY